VTNHLDHQLTAASNRRQQRKPYASPSLSELGCVRDLTATGTTKSAENKGVDTVMKP
jgi:hypothetical protein